MQAGTAIYIRRKALRCTCPIVPSRCSVVPANRSARLEVPALRAIASSLKSGGRCARTRQDDLDFGERARLGIDLD